MDIPIKTDEILMIAAKSLNCNASYVSEQTRWLNINILNKCFSTFSMRMPLDSPLSICKADNKLLSRELLAKNNLPIIKWQLINTAKSLKENTEELYTIKPYLGMKGLGVVTALKFNDVITLINEATEGTYFFIEPYIKGRVFRALVLNHSVIGMYELKAPTIKGNGENTVSELIINFKNRHFDEFNKREEDKDTFYYLKNNNINTSYVPIKNEHIKFTNVFNLCRGANWSQIQIESLNPDFKNVLEKSTEVIGLKLAGVDYILSGEDNNIHILEVNPSPGIIGLTLSINKNGNRIYNFAIAQKILKATFNHLFPQLEIPKPIFEELTEKECIKIIENIKNQC